MIVSKPKFSALFSLGIFILVSLSIGGYNLSLIMQGKGWWLSYILASLFLPLGLLILLRQLWAFKILKFADNKLEVVYPLRFSKKIVSLKNLKYWEETLIKTGTGMFKQIDLVFDQLKVGLSMQENSNYNSVVGYLGKKAPGKRKK